MDNQWQQHHQYHQPVQANNGTCPMCSNFHYPFCPPHPSINQNPRFLPPQGLPFRGPTHVPEPYRLPMDPYRHPANEYKDPMLLHNNSYHPSLDRHSHGYDSYNGSVRPPYGYSNSVGKDFESGGDGNVKRMRVGETESGAAGVNDLRVNSSTVMSKEDERRLSLIRNHGGSAGTLSGSSSNGANMMTGTIAGFIPENSFVGQGCFNGYREDKGGDVFNMPAVMRTSDHQDPGFLSGELGVPSHPNSVSRSHEYKEAHSLSYGHQYLQSNQHHGNIGQDTAIKRKRHDMPSQQGMSNNNPQIPQQGPQVFPERNSLNSSSPYVQRTTTPMNNLGYHDQPLGPCQLQNSMHNEYDFQLPSTLNDIRPSFQQRFPSLKDNHLPYDNISQGNFIPMISEQPPLPSSPPPPLPVDPPYDASFELKVAYKPHPTQPYHQNKSHFSVSTGVMPESHHYLGEGQLFPVQPRPADKVKAIDASHLLMHPHRATRPGHIVIILRGLPGSGKSYLAKMFRDLEVENGGGAPRIHSIDDYFMTENEKVDESELEKSTGSGRAKKKMTKKVMEYCYEPEMEEAYRSSMLKAFKKTLDEGVFTFVIVDDRNLRVADFAQFWAIAKRSGYEAYLLEASYKDPAGCAARNVHGFTQDDIQKMAKLWEEAPAWYLQVDIKSFLHGDDLKDGGIQEVDMDTEDKDLDEAPSEPQAENHDNAEASAIGDHASGSLQDKDGPDGEGNHQREQIKELGKSKWSADFDEDDADRIQGDQRRKNSLSGLIEAYAKDGKSVQWSDQGGNTGFTIGAAKKANLLSLVIGPGAGYNLKSNPLPEVNPASTMNTGEKHSVFQQQLRAERESFKAIFDRRGHRIALDLDEE